jgi:hypothetical protein
MDPAMIDTLAQGDQGFPAGSIDRLRGCWHSASGSPPCASMRISPGADHR